MFEFIDQALGALARGQVFLANHTTFFIVTVGVFGLLVGSFLNVVILRLPKRIEHSWRCQCRELLEIEGGEDQAATPPDLVFSRSRCPHCGHGIRAHENIPVLSYLALRGRCSACRARISPRYPAIELLTAVMMVVLAWRFGPTAQFAGAALLTGILIVAAVIDAETQYLHDALTVPLLWIGMALALWSVFVPLRDAVVGAIAGYLFFWLIFWGYFGLTKLLRGEGREGMGYGDFKLMAALGAWLGWQGLPLVVVLSAVSGAVVGIALLALSRHERGRPMPFGPFIAAAGWVALVWGDAITGLYLRLSGFPA